MLGGPSRRCGVDTHAPAAPPLSSNTVGMAPPRVTARRSHCTAGARADTPRRRRGAVGLGLYGKLRACAVCLKPSRYGAYREFAQGHAHASLCVYIYTWQSLCVISRSFAGLCVLVGCSLAVSFRGSSPFYFPKHDGFCLRVASSSSDDGSRPYEQYSLSGMRRLECVVKRSVLVREFQFNVLAGRGRHFTVWFYGFVGLWGCGVRSRQ